jgi:uncharacterized protein YegP (UPF0339 family)
MSKFVIRDVPSGIKFDLKAGNGETIATSEVYTTEASCKNGIASVQKNAAAAGVADLTAKVQEKVSCPKFEVYADKRREFRFRLKATNGQIIIVSEGYSTKDSCLSGIDSVRRNAADAEIVARE